MKTPTQEDFDSIGKVMGHKKGVPLPGTPEFKEIFEEDKELKRGMGLETRSGTKFLLTKRNGKVIYKILEK